MNPPVFAIDDDGIASGNMGQQSVNSAHRWNSEPARDNRGMARRGDFFEDDRRKSRFSIIKQLCRSEATSNQDFRVLSAWSVVVAIALLTSQHAQQAIV